VSTNGPKWPPSGGLSRVCRFLDQFSRFLPEAWAPFQPRRPSIGLWPVPSPPPDGRRFAVRLRVFLSPPIRVRKPLLPQGWRHLFQGAFEVAPAFSFALPLYGLGGSSRTGSNCGSAGLAPWPKLFFKCGRHVLWRCLPEIAVSCLRRVYLCGRLSVWRTRCPDFSLPPAA